MKKFRQGLLLSFALTILCFALPSAGKAFISPQDSSVILQDDSSSTKAELNLSTGDFTFSSDDGLTVSGTGKVIIKGCTATENVTGPNYRFRITADICTQTGSAAFQSLANGRTYTIRDTNRPGGGTGGGEGGGGTGGGEGETTEPVGGGERPPSGDGSRGSGKPSYPLIGNDVHYVLASGPNAGRPRTARVTKSYDRQRVDLYVFLSPGDGLGDYLVLEMVEPDCCGKPGTWHWPLN